MECNIDIDISSDIAWFKLIYYNIKANGEFPLISTSRIIENEEKELLSYKLSSFFVYIGKFDF